MGLMVDSSEVDEAMRYSSVTGSTGSVAVVVVVEGEVVVEVVVGLVVVVVVVVVGVVVVTAKTRLWKTEGRDVAGRKLWGSGMVV